MLSNYLSTFVLTISNPLTILSFAAIFAGLGGQNLQTGDSIAASLMVAGIFLGSVTWWLLLSYLASRFQKRINPPTMTWINRLAGLIITGFGAAALISLLF